MNATKSLKKQITISTIAIAATLMTWWTLSACKSTSEHTSSSQLIGSESLTVPPAAIVALTPRPAFVAKVLDLLGRDGEIVHCGGTYIQPGVIITAAHCTLTLRSILTYSRQEGSVQAEDLQYRVKSAYFHIQQQEVQVPIKRSSAVAPGSDLALLFFDQSAFAKTLKQRDLPMPKSIPLYLQENAVVADAQLHVYGIGQAQFRRHWHPIFTPFTGDIALIREGGRTHRDRIPVQLHPQTETKHQDHASLRSFASAEEFYRFVSPPPQRFGSPPAEEEGISQSFGEDFDKQIAQYWQSQLTEEGLQEALQAGTKFHVHKTNKQKHKKASDDVHWDVTKFLALTLASPSSSSSPSSRQDKAQAACPGDSGSAVTIMTEQGEQLLGVISRIDMTSQLRQRVLAKHRGQEITGGDLWAAGVYCGDILYLSHLSRFHQELSQHLNSYPQ